MSDDIYRCCPHCKYLLNDKVFTQLRFDYDCPRCRQEKMSEFTLTSNPFSDMVNPTDNPKQE